MGQLRVWRNGWISLTVVGILCLTLAPGAAFSEESDRVEVPQGAGSAVLNGAHIFDDLDPQAPVTVDVVLNIQHRDRLAAFIRETTTPGSPNYRRYLTVEQFADQYGPSKSLVKALTDYLHSYGLQTKVYPDRLIVTVTGTAGMFQEAFDVALGEANFNGKTFKIAKKNPKLPAMLAKNVLCILGLTDYSEVGSRLVKRPAALEEALPQGPLSLTPADMTQRYNATPLYQQGANGAGQTIGIVTLADFNVEDAYQFWSDLGIPVKPDRVRKVPVDGGSGWLGYTETTLDVQQAGAVAPQADVSVYIGPNTDAGFLNTFATAVNENKAQQLSVSWGQSEASIGLAVQYQLQTPQYSESFNQIFMQAAAQGMSLFAASGDAGAYNGTREFGLQSGLPGIADLSIVHPSNSPYITSAGGTTLPVHFKMDALGVDIRNEQERSWGWNYLHPYLDALGYNHPEGWGELYLIGSGGGFSKLFPTPDYQRGVPGVNTYAAMKQWTLSADGSSLTRDAAAVLVTGTGSGRNTPDLAMNADPLTGYLTYLSDPGAPGQESGYTTLGGTSIVAPQLAGISALINDANDTKVGFWNPQIYRFAQQADTPLRPLNTTGATNDNGFYTGTAGTVYNQASGLGVPDFAKLAKKFGR